MAHALQNPSPILLLDEPDAHMHHSLQRSFLRVLRAFAETEKLQVVMASHSETFLRETPLEEVRVIDASLRKAGKYGNVSDLQMELSQAGIWPSRLELAEILRTRRVLVVEGEEDALMLTRLGRILFDDWDSSSKLLQVVSSDGSTESTVRRLQYVQEILGRVIPNGIRIAHFRDRDLLCDEGVSSMRKEAKDKNLSLFISDVRNREALMAKPALVERTVRRVLCEKLPQSVSTAGAIATLVKKCLQDWCAAELDDMPVKVQEYNRSWIRRKYEHEDLRKGEKLLAEFIRKSWQEPLTRKAIPWSLVDGKAVLGSIRRKLTAHKIALADDDILDSMTADDFDECMKQAVTLVHEWCSKQ